MGTPGGDHRPNEYSCKRAREQAQSFIDKEGRTELVVSMDKEPREMEKVSTPSERSANIVGVECPSDRAPVTREARGVDKLESKQMNEELKLFRHIRRGTVYVLLYDDAMWEQNEVRAVVYRHIITGKLWIRPYDEFFDGRFEEIKINDNR